VLERTLGLVALALTMQACAPLATREPRAGTSSLGCMHGALARYDVASHPDDEAHCIAAGLIALHCSKSEAWLAGVGKELRDLFGRGNAEWRDLDSDRRGIECARSATDDTRLVACCTSNRE
jgi:hypothetical protein